MSLLLNDDYEGGELGFFSEKESFIRPETGMAVCFAQHLRLTVLSLSPRVSGGHWYAGLAGSLYDDSSSP